MVRVAVLEQGEGLAQVVGGWHIVPAGPDEQPDLLLVSPRAAVEKSTEPLGCGTVLLPGDAGHLLRSIRARSTVNYGLSSRDTITLSSQKPGRLWVAVQRELVRLDGTVLERQELSVPRLPGFDTRQMLALTGAGLLLGAAARPRGWA